MLKYTHISCPEHSITVQLSKYLKWNRHLIAAQRERSRRSVITSNRGPGANDVHRIRGQIHASMTPFSPPAYVGNGCYFVSGFAAFGDGSMIGRCNSSWLGSTDGGVTWDTVLSDEPGSSGGFVLPVLSTDGTVLHDAANLSLVNASVPAKYSSRSGVSTERVVRSATGFTLVRSSVPRQVTYKLPKPIACWQPPDHAQGKNCPLRLGGSAVPIRLRGDQQHYLTTAMSWWADYSGQGPYNASSINVLLAFRSDDGYAWSYAGTVASAAMLPLSQEGPSEAALEQLADGRVVCVLRTDGGDGAPDHLHASYAVAFSADGGGTWTPPAMLPPSVGSARPQLLLLGGALLLAGGRPTAVSQDPKLWIDRSGSGEATAAWEEHSVSAAHNAFLAQAAAKWTNGTTPLPWWAARPGGLRPGLDRPGWPRMANLSFATASCEADAECVGFTYNETLGNASNATAWMSLKGWGAEATANASWTTFYKPSPRQPFDALVNSSDFPRQSTAYTSLMRAEEERTAVLLYDQWLHHMGNVWRVYAMRVRVD